MNLWQQFLVGLSIFVLLFVAFRIFWGFVCLLMQIDDYLPFVPTSQKALGLLDSANVINNNQTIIDLGSGTGTVLKFFHKRYPDARLIGVERRWLLVWVSRARFIFSRNRPTILHQDFFTYSVQQADVIVGYWITGLLPRLAEKFERECKPGSIVISNAFKLQGMKSFSEEDLRNKSTSIHLYRRHLSF